MKKVYYGMERRVGGTEVNSEAGTGAANWEVISLKRGNQASILRPRLYCKAKSYSATNLERKWMIWEIFGRFGAVVDFLQTKLGLDYGEGSKRERSWES